MKEFEAFILAHSPGLGQPGQLLGRGGAGGREGINNVPCGVHLCTQAHIFTIIFIFDKSMRCYTVKSSLKFIGH